MLDMTTEAQSRGRLAGVDSSQLLAGLRSRVRRVAAEGQAGFSLVELLVVILLSGIIMAAILGMYISALNSVTSQNVRMQNQDDARLAVNQMTRYLRMATSSADNQTSQSNAVATAQPQNIEFYCDLDGDGVAEKVRYYLQGTNLMMQTAEAQWLTSPQPHWAYGSYGTNGLVVQEAIRNGTTPLFRYFRYGDSELEEFTPQNASDRQRIVVVAIDISVNEVPQFARSNVEFSTQVQLRQRFEGGLE